MANKKHNLNAALHFLLGSSLILKGIDKFPHHNILGGLIILFGLIVFSYFVYAIVKKRESRAMHILIHLFEAIVSLFVAYIFYAEGKQYLQYVFVAAALGFFIATFVSIRKKNH